MTLLIAAPSGAGAGGGWNGMEAGKGCWGAGVGGEWQFRPGRGWDSKGGFQCIKKPLKP